MTNKNLISDPQKRKKRTQEKIDLVLEFLTDEIYSTTEILGRYLGVNRSATLSTLYNMEKRGLIRRGSIRFLQSAATTIWGISMAGLREWVEPGEIGKSIYKTFSIGRVRTGLLEHTLTIQKCRIFLEDEKGCFDWSPSRVIPGQNEKRSSLKRWPTYPDGLIKMPVKGYDHNIPLALEVELSRKTPSRYVEIIRKHISNIKKSRYKHVLYFCPDKKKAMSLKDLFLRLICDHKIESFPDIYDEDEDEGAGLERAKGSFTFLSIKGK